MHFGQISFWRLHSEKIMAIFWRVVLEFAMFSTEIYEKKKQQ